MYQWVYQARQGLKGREIARSTKIPYTKSVAPHLREHSSEMCMQPVNRPAMKSGQRPKFVIASSERDVLADVIRNLHAYPEDAYWARRVFDLVRDPATATRVRHHLVLAVQRFAERDPAFFVHERYLSEQLAVWAWPREVLDALEERLELEDPSMRHLVLGRLWLEARRPPEAMSQFYARAARHLSEVREHLRFGSWHEAYCEALSVADAHELGERAREILDSVVEESRERVVLAILRGAARIADWDLYDTHRMAYSGLNPSSEIARLDAARAEDALSMQRKVVSSAAITIPAPAEEAKTVRPPSRL